MMKTKTPLINLRFSSSDDIIKDIVVVDADGSVYIDWQSVEIFSKIPVREEHMMSSGIVKALLAVRDGTWKPVLHKRLN